MPYKLFFTSHFSRKVCRLSKKNSQLKIKINSVLTQIQIDPFVFKLKTHRVHTNKYGKTWGASVTGDIRVLWEFDQEHNLIILLISIGKHSGNIRVYT